MAVKTPDFAYTFTIKKTLMTQQMSVIHEMPPHKTYPWSKMIYNINLEVKNKMVAQKQDGGQLSNSNVNTLN